MHQITYVIAIGLAMLPCTALAQALPLQSRSVFKCDQGGKVVYTDSPCPGASRIEVQPTRGLNMTTGKEQIGRDVRREISREQIAEAVRPITGMNATEFERFGRRTKLSTEAQQECRKLDSSTEELEQQDRTSSRTEKKAVQEQLFNARSRYRQLGC